MFRAVFILLVGSTLLLSGAMSSSAQNVLPKAAPEEQYRFALGKALSKEFDTAIAAFEEFLTLNARHKREADAMFWLGRLYFVQERFELAALAFAEFNLKYPDDARLVDTTLWIARAVSKYAPPSEACAIYPHLANTPKSPHEIFKGIIADLIEQGNCAKRPPINKFNYAKRLVDILGPLDLKTLPAEVNLAELADNEAATIQNQQNLLPEPPPPPPVTADDVAKIRSHVSKCWNLPLGALGQDHLDVEISVALSESGEVLEAEILDKFRFSVDSYFKASALAARRAIVECSPLPIPPEKYSQLKEFVFIFNSEFIGGSTAPPKPNQKVETATPMADNGYTGAEIELNTNAEDLSALPAALQAAQKEADELRERLAALEASAQEQQRVIEEDRLAPIITIARASADGRKGYISGFAQDNVQVAEVLVDGDTVNLGSDGFFEWRGFVPVTGKNVTVEAVDSAALSSTQVIRLERGQIQKPTGPRFDDLDPTLGKSVQRNNDALALIIGISDYERTNAPAMFADKDAQFFHDYAALKLGIPDANITTMINEKAEQGDVLLAVKEWIRRSSKPGKSDIYIFFAGHGLASQDGSRMYLLPYDGRPRLLENTAILREQLFSDIAAANPRSVTVFLDTCYSGATRGPEMLVAARPIVIRARTKVVPEGFTVMTAAAGDQTAKPLEEAKHGMFSYFLMKGMEGDADANQDNEITAGELHAYVQQNVIQQSSGSQTPELQGDADRVLVRFQ